MTRSRWIIFALICLGILGLLFFANHDGSQTSFNGDPAKPLTEGPIPDHAYGSAAHKVVLIEYGDLQCPACGKAQPTVAALKTQYKDKLTFVFRNLPLTSIHPNALAAATAAEAAGMQGKFYQMVDILYAAQSSWTEASPGERGKLFEQYAQMAGVDTARFKQDLTSPNITAKLDRDRTTAKTYKANSTPTFVLNGKKLSDGIAGNPQEFSAAIQKALTEAGLGADSKSQSQHAEAGEVKNE